MPDPENKPPHRPGPQPPPDPIPADDKNLVQFIDHTFAPDEDGLCTWINAIYTPCGFPKVNHAITDDTGDLPVINGHNVDGISGGGQRSE